MDDWKKLLTAQGAQFGGDDVISFGESAADYVALTNTVSQLSHLGLLSAQGPESGKFLQGQCTCDFSSLERGSALSGAICNPKGRMLTSFRACQIQEDLLLLSMDRQLVHPTLHVLEKYAAFFKTELADSSDKYRQLGISGPQAKSLLKTIFPDVPGPNCSAFDGFGNLLYCLTDDLYMVITATAESVQLWQKLSLKFQPTGQSWWQLRLILAGLASVNLKLSEQLVPQMLNFQAIGAISFSKGCYTGQEVVARMEYLGKLKRRTYLIKADSTKLPKSGAEIAMPENSKAVGTVIQAALEDENHLAILAVLREAALEQSELIIDGNKVPIKFAKLPYEIPIQ
jgi:hypothetical protein